MSLHENTVWLEEKQELFDEFLAKQNWAGARAIVDEVGEKFELNGLILHRALEKALDEEAMPLDEADLADRSYPRE